MKYVLFILYIIYIHIFLAEFPDNWDKMEDDEEVKVCLLDREVECEEYDTICNRFHLTLPNSAVIKIYRIQNKLVWKKYRECSEEMKKYNDGILNEKLLFHGTKTTSPEEIYRSNTGFDARCSRQGLWGHGSYFAENASYSDSYAYKNGAMKEMFAASVLTGISFFSEQNNGLTRPPKRQPLINGDSQMELLYDCVTGKACGTRIYITYDSTHTYPSYLIVYQ